MQHLNTGAPHLLAASAGTGLPLRCGCLHALLPQLLPAIHLLPEPEGRCTLTLPRHVPVSLPLCTSADPTPEPHAETEMMMMPIDMVHAD